MFGLGGPAGALPGRPAAPRGAAVRRPAGGDRRRPGRRRGPAAARRRRPGRAAPPALRRGVRPRRRRGRRRAAGAACGWPRSCCSPPPWPWRCRASATCWCWRCWWRPRWRSAAAPAAPRGRWRGGGGGGGGRAWWASTPRTTSAARPGRRWRLRCARPRLARADSAGFARTQRRSGRDHRHADQLRPASGRPPPRRCGG